MEALEAIVAAVLQNKGFWVRTSVRVKLELPKRRNKSDPRTELDVVAYRPKSHEVLVIECKSFLDSRGVQSRAFLNPGDRAKKRYKLFHDLKHWSNVRERLLQQLELDESHRSEPPKVDLCLAAAHIAGVGEIALKEHFKSNGWQLLGPGWLKDGLKELANNDYENDVIIVTAKLLAEKVAQASRKS